MIVVQDVNEQNRCKGLGCIWVGGGCGWWVWLERCCIIIQDVNEQNRWVSVIRKACLWNRDMQPVYHPGAFKKNKWTCCRTGSNLGNQPATGSHDYHVTEIRSLSKNYC